MRILRALALFTSTCLLSGVTACGGPVTKSADSRYAGAYLYGADGNMSNPFGALFDQHPGVLAGMKGTRPMTQIGQDFKARIDAVDRGLKDYNYAGEAYDAVVIAALAAQVAGTTDPKTIARHLNGVTIGPEPCQDVAECLDRARRGHDVAYRGITVRNGFTEAGEPSTTSYGTVHFGDSNQLDGAKTEFLRAGSEGEVSSTEPPKQAAAGQRPVGAPLVFGMLMTRPSASSVTSQARIAGAKLAVEDLNASNGVLGAKVELRDGDDGADPGKAAVQIANHKADGVHVLIGTSGSGVATAVIPEIRRHGLIMISPSNTAASLSTVEDDGLYFRTAPSDVLQARALADMIMRDGARRVTLIGRKDAYGTGLVDGVRKELLATGMTADNIQTLGYQIEGSKVKDAAELGSLARQTLSFHPDGVLIAGLTESADMIKALADAKLVIRH